MRKFTSLFLHLLRSGLAKRDEFFIPVEAPPPSWFTAVHCQEYFSDFVSGSLDEKRMRRIGLPWSPQLVRRTLVEAAGTVLSAQLACEFGIACSLGGGTHHAHHNFGSGFTIFNDVVIAADVVIKEGRASRVLIVDLDVHQGDGTAALASARPSKDVFALSFHCGANFPFRKETSDLDVSFERGAGDDEFLSKLREVLPSVLDSFGPDLVLYLSGVDPFEGDKLGLLNLSEDGLRERDLFVFRECTRRGVPVSGVIGGGYDDDVDKLAARHGLLFESAAQVWREAEGWGGRGVRRRESSEQRQQPESPQERKGDLGGGMRLERLESSSKLESLTSSPAANVSISSPLFSEKAVGSFVTPAVPAVSAVSTPLPVEI
uniref:Histone deacetylase domain-containing protein n=1 Tax=Chromera velia CCMP2878 TaxID=1169474 RepID=A0A0G4G7L2_9ALVE|eukprot:Cvel_20638.t1-p1 / transcript=Cvel_20638.t1 / gene=Cvel_20638 / organism=Chromera_velia_CCMP2878 / gene_product=Uncharacterized protein SYNPCC7002_A1628, putative / transcript_product=Uncharacterized protein SYNPCC7002_A1628, putative / location=Cvel_scaffold1871:10180-12878(-) / protein_length=374 / sequence_SO=supercontig / SO=protein_coding / is_pseudo=false